MNKTKKSRLFIIVLLAIILICQTIPIAKTDGENWLTGWFYRKQHTIIGSTDGLQTNYQVGIKVYYGTGTDGTEVVTGLTFGKIYTDSKCETDFGDIRFTADDGDTEIDYWIESQIDSNYAIIWVEIPNILASPNTLNIYIYYGKSGATTTSNGKATFPDLFDHFLGSSLNLTVFQVDASDGSATVSGSIVRVQGNAGANRYSFSSKSPFITSDPSALRFYSLMESTLASFQIVQLGFSRWGITGFAIFHNYHGIDEVFTRDSLGNLEYDVIGDSYWDSWFTYEITRDGTLATYRVDGTLVASGDFDPDNDDIGVQFYVRDSEKDLYCDWVLIREYTPNEPTHGAWGSEESAIPKPSIPDLLFGAGFNSSSPYVELHWNHSLVNVQFFEVQNSTDAISWDYLGQSTTTNYTDYLVLNGTERYYIVRACNQTGGFWFNSSFTEYNFEKVYFILGLADEAPPVDDYSIIFLAIGLILMLAIYFLYARDK